MFKHIVLVAACVIALQGIAFCDSAPRTIGGGDRGWEGWTSTGTGWRQTDAARQENPAAAVAHVESGEEATGTFRSPVFTVQGDVIEFWANGWDSREGARGLNKCLLRLGKDDSIVREADPPQNDAFVPRSWYVSDLAGQEVYFEAVDGVSGPGFAWIGLAKVIEKHKGVPSSSSPYRALPMSSTGTWGILTTTGGSYVGEPYLSSMAQGEPGTGEIWSPTFTLSVPRIVLKIRGWDGRHGELGKDRFLLTDAATGEIVRKSEPPLSDEPTRLDWDVAELKGRSVRVGMIDANSDSSFAWMGIDEVDAGSDYHVKFNGKSMAGWVAKVPQLDYADAGGVPFLVGAGSIAAENGGTVARIDCRVKHIYLLGMTNSLDQGNYCWFSPMDYAGRFFVGDRLGAIRVSYADGAVDLYPLVLGESLWWGRKFTQNPEPFISDAAAAAALKDSLRLYPAAPTPDGRYLAVISPRSAAVQSVEIVDSAAKNGSPVILGLTVEPESGEAVPKGVALPHDAASAELAAFVKTSALRREGDDETTAAKKLVQLREALYTTRSNFPKHVDVTVPEGYKGPEFKFEGDAFAEVLTNVLYANLEDISERVDAEGMYHTSAKGAATWGGYEGFGTYQEGIGSYYPQSWTRDMGRSLGELCAFGYLDEAKRCADYVFAKARVWEERPELRLNGVVLPRHICRVLQGPSTDPGQGCFENDGQGLTALFVYNLWRRIPDRDEWLKAHWEDVQGLGDWVIWQFEHPEVSGAKEVLRTDSECSGGIGYSVYADMACMEALKGLADMAVSIGHASKAAQWRARAEKMRAGCESTYIVNDEKYGKVWTLAHSGWPNRSTVMGPVIIPSDRSGFLGQTNDKWRAYNDATYRRQVESYKPFGFFGVAMGYGQGFVTQSALLLDKMDDATEMLRWAARATYCAAYKPYIVPEGCEVDPTGRFWHRTGDLGNGVQQAEIVKALRVVIGIDDSSPSRLSLCPRMPVGWTGVSIGRYPAVIRPGAETEIAQLSYSLTHKQEGWRLDVSSDRPLPAVDMRLGPLVSDSSKSGSWTESLRGKVADSVLVNGTRVKADVVRSGDSWWVKLSVPAGQTKLDVRIAEVVAGGLGQ